MRILRGRRTSGHNTYQDITYQDIRVQGPTMEPACLCGGGMRRAADPFVRAVSSTDLAGGRLGNSGVMPRPRPVLTVLALIVAAFAVCAALLLGRDRSVEPELGPAVEVRLDPSTSQPAPSSGLPSSAAPSSRPSPSGGADTVPRQAPIPAGDDDDDDEPDTDDDD